MSSERILLVEDNAELRDIATMLLDQLGYQVVEAENGAAALDRLSGGEPIDLVFSDIVMPGEPNGIGLAKLIRQRYPGLPVLLTTGYAREVELAGRHIPILRKPYRLNTLEEALRALLPR